MGQLNQQGIDLIAGYKVEAIIQMIDCAKQFEGDSEGCKSNLVNILHRLLTREDDERHFAIYPNSRDIPFNEYTGDQVLWDWGIIDRETRQVTMNGGLMFVRSTGQWSSHT